MPEKEHRSLFERLFEDPHGGVREDRREKVLRYIVHRLREEASLEEVLEEEYVRRNVTDAELEEIIRKPELVHAAREHLEEAFESGELDPEEERKRR